VERRRHFSGPCGFDRVQVRRGSFRLLLRLRYAFAAPAQYP
jgi:hypothetical protein